MEPGKCCTAHSDPDLDCPRAAQVRSLRSTSLPQCSYVGGSPGPTCTDFGSLASTAQHVLLALSDHQNWLCDSVHPASPQAQGHQLHISKGSRCACLACVDRSPTGKGCDRASPSSRYEVVVLKPLLHCTQERRWVTSNLGPACLEPVPSQATVQDVNAETHLRVHPSPRLVCSDRT